MRVHHFLLPLCLIAGSGPVSAKMSDVSCDDSARLADTLVQVGVERQGVGLRDPETLLEIWVDRRNGDWLIVQNYTNGTSCIIAMGENWERIPIEPA